MKYFITSAAVLAILLPSCAPAEANVVLWTGMTGGNWTDAINWSSYPFLPDADDDVYIAIPGLAVVNHASGAHAARTLSSEDILNLTGGTLSFLAASQCTNGFWLGGGSVAGAGSLSIYGSGYWSSGGIGITGGVINVGTWDITGTGSKFLTGRLINDGSVNHNATVDIKDGGMLRNEQFRTYDIQNDFGFTCSTGIGTIENAGVMVKSAGAGTAAIYPFFKNTDHLDVGSGTLRLWGGGTYTDAWSSVTSADAELQFYGGTFTMAGTEHIGGAGKGSLHNGTLSINHGAVLELGLTGGFTLASGAVSGLGQLENTSTLKWSGASLYNAENVRNESNLHIEGSTARNFFNSNLGNYGTVYHTGAGNVSFSGGSAIHNAGEHNFYSDASYLSSDGTGLISNSGTMRKAFSPGTTVIQPRLESAGGITVDSGTLKLQGGGRFADCGFAVSGSTSYLELAQGLYTVSGDVGVTGNGYANLTGGTLNFDYGANLESGIMDGGLLLAGTTITGEGNLVNRQKAVWSASTIVGGPHFINHGSLTLSGGVIKSLQSAHFYNYGEVLQTGTGPAVTATSSVTLQGLSRYIFRADSGISGTGPVTCGGIVRKEYSDGESRIDNPFTLEYGEIDVQSGTLRFAGGGSWFGGAVTASTDCAVTLSAGTYNIQEDLRASGNGSVTLSGGTINLLAGALPRFNMVQGLHLSGATFTGPGTIYNDGNADWSAGSLTADTRLSNNSTLSLAGSGVKSMNASKLYNSGTLLHTGSGSLNLAGGSLLVNTSRYYMDSDAGVTAGAGGGRVSNGGEFVKRAASGISIIAVPFDSDGGLIDIQSGTVRLAGGGQWREGTVDIGAGAALEVSDGVLEVSERAVAGGSGSATLGGEIALSLGAVAEFDLQSGLQLDGCVISGGGSLINRGLARWFEGAVVDDATLMNYGTLDLLRSEERALRGGTLLTLGEVNHLDGPMVVYEGSTLRVAAAGVYNLHNDRSIDGDGTFRNEGITRKSGARAVSTIDCRLDNVGTIEAAEGVLGVRGAIAQVEGDALTGGTWLVGPDAVLDLRSADGFALNQGAVTIDYGGEFPQIDALEANGGVFRLLNGRSFDGPKRFDNAGTVELAGGEFRTPLFINTGVWQGFGTLVGRFDNPGRLEPAAGFECVSITDDYVQRDTGVLAIRLSGAESDFYGKVITAGVANLAGTLEITLAPGFLPAAGQKFFIIDAAVRSGQFSTLTAPALPGGLSFNPIYTDSGVVLVVGTPMPATVPVPDVVEARNRDLGAWISVPAIVSAAFADGTFYVQDASRVAGLRVVCAHDAPLVGQRVHIAGQLTADARCLSLAQAAWAPYPTVPVAPGPLFVRQSGLGGISIGRQDGVAGGIGANNIGLLVRTAGAVTYVKPYEFAYVDDGSGLADGNSLGPSGAPVKGVRVIFPPNATISPLAGHAVVTGISCRNSLGGLSRRAILLRSRGDIHTY